MNTLSPLQLPLRNLKIEKLIQPTPTLTTAVQEPRIIL